MQFDPVQRCSFIGLFGGAAAWPPVGVLNDPRAVTNRVRINTLALGIRLPTMFGAREFGEAERLMSYGAHVPDLYRRAAGLIDKVLRGAKPADLAVERPTKLELMINL